MSYWARTVIVPLLVLAAMKPRARNPRNVHIAELFVPARRDRAGRAPHQSRAWAAFFGVLDRTLKLVDPLWPKRSRKRAIEGLRRLRLRDG